MAWMGYLGLGTSPGAIVRRMDMIPIELPPEADVHIDEPRAFQPLNDVLRSVIRSSLIGPRIDVEFVESPIAFVDNKTIRMEKTRFKSWDEFYTMCTDSVKAIAPDQRLVVVLYQVFEGEVYIGKPSDWPTARKERVLVVRHGFATRQMTPMEQLAAGGDDDV